MLFLKRIAMRLITNTILLIMLAGLGSTPALAKWKICWRHNQCQQSWAERQKTKARLSALYNAMHKVDPTGANSLRRVYRVSRTEVWLENHPRVLKRIFHPHKKTTPPKPNNQDDG